MVLPTEIVAVKPLPQKACSQWIDKSDARVNRGTITASRLTFPVVLQLMFSLLNQKKVAILLQLLCKDYLM